MSLLREQVFVIAQKSYQDHLVAGTSGNVSMIDRQGERIAITPSGLEYSSMTAMDIVVINLEGHVIEGERTPSSEWQMHAVMYGKLPSIQAIVHTHSPYATSFSVLNEGIPVVLIEMVLLGGDIPVAPFALAGTSELGIKVAQTLRESKRFACLLQNHGVVTIGSTLEEAYMRAIYLEDAAKIYHYARAIGTPHRVADKDVTEMMIKLGLHEEVR